MSEGRSLRRRVFGEHLTFLNDRPPLLTHPTAPGTSGVALPLSTRRAPLTGGPGPASREGRRSSSNCHFQVFGLKRSLCPGAASGAACPESCHLVRSPSQPSSRHPSASVPLCWATGQALSPISNMQPSQAAPWKGKRDFSASELLPHSPRFLCCTRPSPGALC